MFTKLLLASSALGALSAPVANYQHTTQEGNVNITYQYETNEVNSIDDLVVGNIYHFYIDGANSLGLDDLFGGFGYLDLYIVHGYCSFYLSAIDVDEVLQPVVLTDNYTLSLYFEYNNLYAYLGQYSTEGDNYFSIELSEISSLDFDFDFIYLSSNDLSTNSLSYISSSNYNVITNVEEVYHTGLFGNLADFLRYYVYGGIPHVTDISFEVGNQTLTILDWLVTTTSIALSILCLFLLYHFFRWVFKLVSGVILLR